MESLNKTRLELQRLEQLRSRHQQEAIKLQLKEQILLYQQEVLHPLLLRLRLAVWEPLEQPAACRDDYLLKVLLEILHEDRLERLRREKRKLIEEQMQCKRRECLLSSHPMLEPLLERERRMHRQEKERRVRMLEKEQPLTLETYWRVHWLQCYLRSSRLRERERRVRRRLECSLERKSLVRRERLVKVLRMERRERLHMERLRRQRLAIPRGGVKFSVMASANGGIDIKIDLHRTHSPKLLRLKGAPKKMGTLFTKGKARRGIAGAIEDIKKQLQEVADRRAGCKVDEIVAKPAPKSLIDPRLEAMHKEVKQLIGIDKSMGELISMLTPSQEGDDVSDNKIMKMVSVVGVGGLGKTTLAKASYDHPCQSIHVLRISADSGLCYEWIRKAKTCLNNLFAWEPTPRPDRFSENSPCDIKFSVITSAKRGLAMNIDSDMTHVLKYLSVDHTLVQMALFSRKRFKDIFAYLKSMEPKRTFDMAKRLCSSASSNVYEAGLTSAKPMAGSLSSGKYYEFNTRKSITRRTENKSQNLIQPFVPFIIHGHAIEAVVAKTSATWAVATSAPHHATGNPTLLSGFVTMYDDQFVHAVDGVPMPVRARGAVVTDAIVIPDVWFVPGLTANLVSVSQLAELDYSVGFGSRECCIRSAAGGTIVGKAHLREGGVYILDFLKVSLAI